MVSNLRVIAADRSGMPTGSVPASWYPPAEALKMATADNGQLVITG